MKYVCVDQKDPSNYYRRQQVQRSDVERPACQRLPVILCSLLLRTSKNVEVTFLPKKTRTSVSPEKVPATCPQVFVDASQVVHSRPYCVGYRKSL